MGSEEKMNHWKTDKLGLATFAKCKGAEVVGVQGRNFMMQSEKTETEWAIDYANSTENDFNNNLISLNEMRRKA